MRPVLTPKQMRVIDAEAVTDGAPMETLIARAGAAVARAAKRMMGGLYGRTVVVVTGKGNNGADGRVTGRLLADQGVRVIVIDADRMPPRLPVCDLIIDAAYGTGFRGDWHPPSTNGVPVLAVDVPSGLDGLTGLAAPGAWRADRTVTFVALKPGLLLGAGPALSGEVELADIGIVLGMGNVDINEVEASDVGCWLPRRAPDSHKWKSAVFSLAGSAGMMGAANLCASAAMRSGAGIVHAASPGIVSDRTTPIEVVRKSLPMLDWSSDILADVNGENARFKSMVVGPGLGRDDGTVAETRKVISGSNVPMVIDGDGLFAVAWGGDGARDIVRSRGAGTVLTPHDGEFTNLLGYPPSHDRVASARRLATDTNCVCLLKGTTTVVAEPSGQVLIVSNGDQRLATAGTGDVLAGIIGALLAQGMHPFRAAASGAFLHARAASLFPADEGMVASDLLDLLPRAITEVRMT
jgi:NAD(P)H-hydrate epimerase